MENSPSWETDDHTDDQEIRLLWNLKAHTVKRTIGHLCISPPTVIGSSFQ
jgi:hypothetical protein